MLEGHNYRDPSLPSVSVDVHHYIFLVCCVLELTFFMGVYSV